MVQRTRRKNYDNIQIKSHSLRKTAETYGERRETCIHKCKKCFNQKSTQHTTQHPGDNEDALWKMIEDKKRSRDSSDQIICTAKS